MSTAGAVAAGALADRMSAIVGARHVVSDDAGLSTYECDGLTGYRVRPALVVLPGSTDEVAAVLRAAREAGRTTSAGRTR